MVNLAIEATAQYLVSRDKDLLDLMDESRPEGRDFRQRFPHVIILDPVAFLHALTEAQQAAAEPEPAGEDEPAQNGARDAETGP